jgi:chloramphenicol 3-O-phosphotransferase
LHWRLVQYSTLRIGFVSRIGRGTEEKGKVLIVTGPAASGKTSVARRIAEQSLDPSVHLHADDFFHALKVGRLRGWEEGSTPQHEVVFEAIGSATGAFANGGYFVVLDSLIRPRYFDIVTGVIRSSRIELHYVVLRPSLSETHSRSHNRDETDRHNDGILEELHGAFVNMGELESHVIDNTTLDVEQTVEEVASRMERGELQI